MPNINPVPSEARVAAYLRHLPQAKSSSIACELAAAELQVNYGAIRYAAQQAGVYQPCRAGHEPPTEETKAHFRRALMNYRGGLDSDTIKREEEL